jgi:hypothetical protein
LSTTAQRPSAPLLARSLSKILPPGPILVLLVILAGLASGLGIGGAAVLVTCVIVIPGLLYKWSKIPFRRHGLPDYLRVRLLAIFTFLAAVICFILPLGALVPLTLTALFVGNATLGFFRRHANLSGHVSVITFAGLWIVSVYGISWAWLLVLSPLMLLSRVSLREHTLREALAGAFLGMATYAFFLLATFWSGI